MMSYDNIINERRAVSGMRIGKGNLSTRGKVAQLPFSPPQIPHDLVGRQDWKPATKPQYHGKA
jgi:hypothetical protein